MLADILNKLCIFCSRVQQSTQQGSFKHILKGILENNVLTLAKYLNDLFLVTDFDCVQIKKKAYQGKLREIIGPTMVYKQANTTNIQENIPENLALSENQREQFIK